MAKFTKEQKFLLHRKIREILVKDLSNKYCDLLDAAYAKLHIREGYDKDNRRGIYIGFGANDKNIKASYPGCETVDKFAIIDSIKNAQFSNASYEGNQITLTLNPSMKVNSKFKALQDKFKNISKKHTKEIQIINKDCADAERQVGKMLEPINEWLRDDLPLELEFGLNKPDLESFLKSLTSKIPT